MTLTLATFNLCNLGVDAQPERWRRVVSVIAGDLGGPDILAVQEIKAGGPRGSNRQIPANEVYDRLIEAINSAGGPDYDFREVPPLANQEGGQAGANIRVGLLFNRQRLVLRDCGRAGPEDATSIRTADPLPSLTLNPGRIAPEHAAFAGDPNRHWLPSRKALAAEFRYAGERLFTIICHLKSMRAATRRRQDYAKSQRNAQASIIHDFALQLLRCDPNAKVAILGDMNDVPSSKTLKILKGELFYNVLETVPKSLRYTRIHEGKPQALDHILLSPRLTLGANAYIPHVNSDSAGQQRASDHDPVLVRLAMMT